MYQVIKKLEENYYKEVQKEENPNPNQISQESQKISQLSRIDHRKLRRYKFQRISSLKDKRLRQIDKSLNKLLLLLLQSYLFELASSRNQKQFVFLFSRRKGKQRLKQKEKRRPRSYETNTELSYSNHAKEEKPYDNNEEIYKKNQVEIRSSTSSKIRRNVYESSSYEQISIFYKYFKKTVVESLEFSSIQQWRASRNRQYNEAYALLEAEEERTRHISYLRKILKSARSAKRKSYRTMDLFRKVQRNPKYIT
jgi:hypothetical protein